MLLIEYLVRTNGGIHTLEWTSFVPVLLFNMWLGWAMLAAALQTGDGRRAGLEALRIPVVTFVQLFIVSIAIAIPIAIGTLFLIVPGIYLMLMWSQIGPLIISGRAGWFTSVGESARLTRGNRGRIFVLMLVPVLVTIPGQIILQHSGDPTGITVSWAATFLWTTLVTTYLAFVMATIYDRLKHRESPV